LQPTGEQQGAEGEHTVGLGDTRVAFLNLRDFGAVGDGKADDTVAITDAIQAGRERRLPVYFTRGEYRVTKPLVIEAQSLIGSEAAGWNADVCPMPRVMVDHAGGSAVTMQDGASIHGLAFAYDRRCDTRYPETVLLAGIGLALSNVCIQYPDDAIIADGKNNIGRLNIENIFIVAPRGTGVYVTRTHDIATLRSIEVWNNAKEMFPGPAFKFGHNAGLRAIHLFAYNVEVGFEVVEDGKEGTWATFAECGTDFCNVGWSVKGNARHDFGITGGYYRNHHESLRIDSRRSNIRVSGAELKSNGAPAVVSQACHSLIMNACRFWRDCRLSPADLLCRRRLD